MPTLLTKHYRRDYTSEIITFVEDDQMKSLAVQCRDLPYDFGARNAIVIGNGLSKNLPEIRLLIDTNSRKLAESYKLTYACNRAFFDTPADYFVIGDRDIMQEIAPDDHSKCFISYDKWLTRRQANMIPYYSHLDTGTTAAYLAAFDGAQKIFLLGFDGSDGVQVGNAYAGQPAYKTPALPECFDKFHMFLYDLVKLYKNIEFYRVNTQYTGKTNVDLSALPNYHEVSVREAVLLGDF
jgi:hypothetical protein